MEHVSELIVSFVLMQIQAYILQISSAQRKDSPHIMQPPWQLSLTVAGLGLQALLGPNHDDCSDWTSLIMCLPTRPRDEVSDVKIKVADWDRGSST